MATVSKNKKVAETPLMKQYNGIKAKHPDAMLLFRVGDFYETFGDDAIKAANILGIVLTKRKNGAAASIELAGFPHHSLDTYLPKLVRAGQRVAICDQLEDPKLTKKIVKRGVTELVTPGISYNDKILDNKSNNFLAAIHFGKKEIGISFLDISTGEFILAQGSEAYIDKLIQGFQPSEVLFQKRLNQKFSTAFGDQLYTYQLDDWVFTKEFGYESLTNHFDTNSLKGFGVEELHEGIIAAGAVLHYLSNTEHNKVQHISNLSRIEEDKYVWLDRFTVRNLELIYSTNDNAKTLIQIMDKTNSPMGARLMKRWMVLPLKNQQLIEERLNIVSHFVAEKAVSSELRELISQTGDLERLISKVAVGRVMPREIVQLKITLELIDPIKELCKNSNVKALIALADQLNPCSSASEKIKTEIEDEPAASVAKGKVIKDGVNKELDELRAIAYSGKNYLQQLQERDSEKTGIPSLKIAFNNVFGYYIEVRNTHKDKVPEEWIRKQTLVNAERYITEELKEYEAKIMGAEEKILGIETKILNDLILALSAYIQPIQHNANLIAKLDCLLSFAYLAVSNNYAKPEINESFDLEIKEGRHPVIEQQLSAGETYISNDISLNVKEQQIIMITGPNMSGKSALLRQTALIVLMAQMGCYVPAKSAKIGLVDKIFTRVGASDNISSGESTFMVEMNETASILNNISARSLILLDEIGRGTSTYDGISIAWAIAEYIHEHPLAKAKTLFATHYHELNKMTNAYPRIKNYNVSVKDVGNKVIFLRKLVAGGSNHSFGIHVAKMAGMPKSVLKKANEILGGLEKSHAAELSDKTKKLVDESDQQLSFFQLDDPILEDIRDELLKTDINTLTPVEALLKLNEIKKLIGG